MNEQQKKIVGVSLIFLFFFIGIGYSTGVLKVWRGLAYGGWVTGAKWYNLQETWYVWGIIVILLGIVEYLIFGKK